MSEVSYISSHRCLSLVFFSHNSVCLLSAYNFAIFLSMNMNIILCFNSRIQIRLVSHNSQLIRSTGCQTLSASRKYMHNNNCGHTRAIRMTVLTHVSWSCLYVTDAIRIKTIESECRIMCRLSFRRGKCQAEAAAFDIQIGLV